VVRYIQRLRLLAAHAALCNAGDGRSIAAIAEGTGFYDPSAFSRAFRREFGLTPSDLRAATIGRWRKFFYFFPHEKCPDPFGSGRWLKLLPLPR
jgi:AraC-like DNA-binding protein